MSVMPGRGQSSLWSLVTVPYVDESGSKFLI